MQSERQWKSLKLNRKKNDNNQAVWDLWENLKHITFHIIQEIEGKEKGTENLLEAIITENFPSDLGKETDMRVQEAQSPNEIYDKN